MTEPTPNEIAALIAALGENMNLWIWDFAHSVHMISAALVDGRLTAEILDGYPADHSYPEQLSRAIAHQAGMVFDDDAAVQTADGWRNTVDAEAVGVGIEALRGLMVGDTGIHEKTWSFYEEMLDEYGLSIERVGEIMRHCAGDSLLDAARLILAGGAWLSSGVLWAR